MDRLSVRDLTVDDVADIGWAGSPSHLRYVVKSLERAQRGEVAFLAVAKDNLVVGIGAVDFERFSDSAVLWQINVHTDHQRQGVGTHLIHALEVCAAQRGFHQTELAVEMDNTRAQQLYQRLGYRIAESYLDEWDAEDANGIAVRHQTVCTVLRKGIHRR